MSYSDSELEGLLADLESDSVERKESFKGEAPVKVREAVCAFANDLSGRGKPGVVFIGARDDGSPSGLALTDELLLQLSDIKTDGNLVPPPTMTVAVLDRADFIASDPEGRPGWAPPGPGSDAIETDPALVAELRTTASWRICPSSRADGKRETPSRPGSTGTACAASARSTSRRRARANTAQ